jgi:hypothetical protein
MIVACSEEVLDGNQILTNSRHNSFSSAGVCRHSHQLSSKAVTGTNRLAGPYPDPFTHCYHPALTHSRSNINQHTTADTDHPIQDEVSRQSH